MYDICIERREHPDSLASIGETLEARGVNIYGLSLAKFDGKDIIHLAVDEPKLAEQVLEDSGVSISEVSEVYVLEKDRKQITGKPGNFGGICRTLAENGIAIRFGYPAEGNRFIFGVDDVEKVRQLLE